jgi:hypothetical protein
MLGIIVGNLAVPRHELVGILGCLIELNYPIKMGIYLALELLIGSMRQHWCIQQGMAHRVVKLGGFQSLGYRP